jgi:hypothetical protein
VTWTSAGFRKKRKSWDDRYKSAEIHPDPQTLDLAIPIFERQVDAAVSRIERAETKAALVIPAIGVVFGIVGPLVPQTALGKPGMLAALLAVSIVMTIACALLAVITLLPRPRSVGPEADQVMRGSASALDDAKWDYFKSLGFAADSSDQLALSKAKWLAWCLAAAAIAIVLFVVFAAAGGLRP